MVSNSEILDVYADLISDLGFKITYNDINGTMSNVVGLYIREAGSPLKGLSGDFKMYQVDISLRIHGDTKDGSQRHCEEILETIRQRLEFSNRDYENFSILGSSLRARGVMIGKTTSKIPVYNIAFLVKFI